MATLPADVEEPSDAELIDAVRGGTVSAYGPLYQRHVASAYNLARQLSRSPAEADDLVSEAFAKVLDRLRAGRGPDSAFRAYLLTALRHVAYDKTRRDRKVELSDDVGAVNGAAAAVSVPFSDTAVAGLERSLAARAFARLPERWQAVLWHTEIEGQSPAEVAPLLGLTPNGVSALAYRAREGLRQAYLQVHLVESTADHCRATTGRLGSWTRRGLARREKAQVEKHLDECARCRELAAELTDVNGSLRAVIAPLVLGTGAAGYLATTGATKAALVTAGVTSGVSAGAGATAATVSRPILELAATAAALTVAVTAGLTTGDAGGFGSAEQARDPAQQLRSTPMPQPLPLAPNGSTAPSTSTDGTRSSSGPAGWQPDSGTQRPANGPGGVGSLAVSGPSAQVTLGPGRPPAEVPITVRNVGAGRSAPVSVTLTLPPGVRAVAGKSALTADPTLRRNGAPGGSTRCPAGAPTVTCTTPAGLDPGASATLVFQLTANGNASSGQVIGSISSAGPAATISIDVAVQRPSGKDKDKPPKHKPPVPKPPAPSPSVPAPAPPEPSEPVPTHRPAIPVPAPPAPPEPAHRPPIPTASAPAVTMQATDPAGFADTTASTDTAESTESMESTGAAEPTGSTGAAATSGHYVE